MELYTKSLHKKCAGKKLNFKKDNRNTQQEYFLTKHFIEKY